MEREDFEPDESKFLDLPVIKIAGDDWKQRVYRQMENEPDLYGVIDAIMDLARKGMKATAVIVEPYVSTDWADEYQHLYSRVFRETPRVTHRLHFFTGLGEKLEPITKDDILNDRKAAHDAYLGYSVVRPLTPAAAGNTVLRSPHRVRDNKFIRCVSEFKVHLMGAELTVEGAPFIQQDRQVSVCAEADLWMIARYMHARSESRRFRPSEMARLASPQLQSPPARDGLFGEEMRNALLKMDLNAELIYPKDSVEALRLIYSWVHSEIPVVVGIPNHVVTLNGVSYGMKANKSGIKDSTSMYVDAFIGHDDHRGPYREFPVSFKKPPHGMKGAPKEILYLGGDDQVDWCLAAVPQRVNLRVTDVQSFVEHWIAKKALSKLGVRRDGTPGLTAAELDGLITRSYLRRSDKFKTEMYPPKSSSLWEMPIKWRSRKVVARYWSMKLPRFVWVVELAREFDVSEKGPFHHDIVGELVFDSTSHYEDTQNALLAAHLGGKFLFRQGPETPRPRFAEGLPDTPYSPLVAQLEN